MAGAGRGSSALDRQLRKAMDANLQELELMHKRVNACSFAYTASCVRHFTCMALRLRLEKGPGQANGFGLALYPPEEPTGILFLSISPNSCRRTSG